MLWQSDSSCCARISPTDSRGGNEIIGTEFVKQSCIFEKQMQSKFARDIIGVCKTWYITRYWRKWPEQFSISINQFYTKIQFYWTELNWTEVFQVEKHVSNV